VDRIALMRPEVHHTGDKNGFPKVSSSRPATGDRIGIGHLDYLSRVECQFNNPSMQKALRGSKWLVLRPWRRGYTETAWNNKFQIH